MFFRKKPKIKRTVHQLNIRFKSGDILSFEARGFDEKKIIEPWKLFFKWYFGRADSEVFNLRTDNGMTVFRKNTIDKFSAKVVLIDG